MPWCEDCARYWTPNSMAADGSCPTCGDVIVDADELADQLRAPWHFKVLVGAAVLYLGWRLVQGVIWALGGS